MNKKILILVFIQFFVICVPFGHATEKFSGTILSITKPGEQDWPRISGNMVVWRLYTDAVYAYNLSSGETKLLMSGNNPRGLDISGNLVCYSPGDIYVYDLISDSVITVSNNPADQWGVKIDDTRIVWTDERNDGGDIYMYDLLQSKEFRITSSSDIESGPDISGDRIVYRKVHPGDEYTDNWLLCLYDYLTTTEIVIETNLNSECWPAIDGNIVVWTNRNRDIYMYNVSSGVKTPVCINSATQRLPSVSNTIIAWEDNRNDNKDIYVYDISQKKEVQITDSLIDQDWVCVDNERIVWHQKAVEPDAFTDIYIAVPEHLVSSFTIGTDLVTYDSGATISITGGLTLEYASTHLKIYSANIKQKTVETVFDEDVSPVVGIMTEYSEFNSGMPLEWTSSTDGTYQMVALLSLEEPYHADAIAESLFFSVGSEPIFVISESNTLTYLMCAIIACIILKWINK